MPCGSRWLIAPGRLQGITLYPADPMVFDTIVEILDYKPSYEVIGVACNIGLLDTPTKGGRTCDREARKLLKFPRSGAIVSAPIRSALKATTYAEAYRLNGGMSSVAYNHLHQIAELDTAIEPYWQRTVFEVHPELSYYQLNGDVPMNYSKHGDRGPAERKALLEKRIPGITQITDARLPRVRRAHLLDAAACLWTARRIAGRAVNRVPEDPEWDEQGLRMEIVR